MKKWREKKVNFWPFCFWCDHGNSFKIIMFFRCGRIRCTRGNIYIYISGVKGIVSTWKKKVQHEAEKKVICFSIRKKDIYISRPSRKLVLSWKKDFWISIFFSVLVKKKRTIKAKNIVLVSSEKKRFKIFYKT